MAALFDIDDTSMPKTADTVSHVIMLAWYFTALYHQQYWMVANAVNAVRRALRGEAEVHFGHAVHRQHWVRRGQYHQCRQARVITVTIPLSSQRRHIGVTSLQAHRPALLPALIPSSSPSPDNINEKDAYCYTLITTCHRRMLLFIGLVSTVVSRRWHRHCCRRVIGTRRR